MFVYCNPGTWRSGIWLFLWQLVIQNHCRISRPYFYRRWWFVLSGRYQSWETSSELQKVRWKWDFNIEDCSDPKYQRRWSTSFCDVMLRWSTNEWQGNCIRKSSVFIWKGEIGLGFRTIDSSSVRNDFIKMDIIAWQDELSIWSIKSNDFRFCTLAYKV
mgnify:CR=1 FL=1